MGKAQKLKVQRKIDRKIEEQEKKNKRKLIKKLSIGILLLIILGIGAYSGSIYVKKNWPNQNKATATTDKTAKHKTYSKEPDMQIDVKKTYIAKLETNRGNFEIQLNAKDAPKTVNNFVFLSKEGFYNGLTFHRIVKDFMIQGGDPKGDGTGDPGYKFNDENIVGDYTPGTVAMANSGKNTNGSQFFIMTGDYSKGKLQKNYVIFGKVISGMDIVKQIGQSATADNGQGEQSKPKEQVLINKITIEEK